MLSVENVVKKYVTNSGNAGQSYKDGINAVTENPMAKAATEDAENRMLAGIQRSMGKRRSKLLAKTLESWKAAASSKSDRYTSGTRLAADKVRAHFQEWSPTYEQASQAAKALPKGGLENAKARVGAAIEVLMRKAGTL